MKIKQLYLKNYGRFEDLTIDFAPTKEKSGNVTVIVGNNGAGKSQILQALAVNFSWFVGFLRTGKSIGFKIDHSLIKNNTNETLISIITDFKQYNSSSFVEKNNNVKWDITSIRDGRASELEDNLKQIEFVAKKYRNNLAHSHYVPLPLIVYYPVERSILNTIESTAINLSQDFDQIDAYIGALDGDRIDFNDFIQWFREREDIENAIFRQSMKTVQSKLKDKHKEVEKVSKEIKIIEQEISQLRTVDEEYRKLEKKIQTLNSSLLELMIKYDELSTVNQNHLSNDKILSLTKDALTTFTGFNDIHIQRQGTPTMIVEKDSEELDVKQLSQGEKSLLALVGDIARRLAILNPIMDNPLEGEGVVMIDEVDLHLHPKWQHDLIDKMVKTFPNVQFILTTHSPHVISDRNDMLVYSLDDGELFEQPNMYGQDANTVLNDVMGVPFRDPEIEKKFVSIRRQISAKNYDNAKSEIDTLATEIPSDNIELLKCRLMLAQAKIESSEGQ